MPCCHADFALLEGSDRGFTVGMPTFTFGAGVLAEAGPQAAELGLRRVAVFTDRRVRASEAFASVAASLAAAGIDAVIFDEVEVEPTDASFQNASRFAREAAVDGYVSVGGGSVMDTCKAANLYAAHPGRIHDLRERADRRRAEGAGSGQAAHRLPDDFRDRVGDDRHRHLRPAVDQRQDRHHLAPTDPDRRAGRPRRDPDPAVGGGGRDRLRLHEPCARVDHRARLSAPLESVAGVDRPVSQGANPFSDMLARQALESVGKFLVRAVNDADDTEARTEMMYAAMLAGIAFNAAGCHLPHGLSYAVSAQARDWHVNGYPEGKSLVPHGMAVVLNNPSVWRFTAPAHPQRHLHCACCLGADARGAGPEDAGEVLAKRVIELMQATGMPNGLSALGFGPGDVDALATGAEPQYRVIRNAPADVGREELRSLFGSAMRYW